MNNESRIYASAKFASIPTVCLGVVHIVDSTNDFAYLLTLIIALPAYLVAVMSNPPRYLESYVMLPLVFIQWFSIAYIFQTLKELFKRRSGNK